MLRKLLLAGFTATLALAGDRGAQWAKVETAINQGLPATAVKELGPILKGALADRAHGEAVKAIALRISLEGTIQGNKPEERITRMQVELAKAPREMKPVLEVIQARWYWSYFKGNRWRFMERSRLAQGSGTDLTTWDLPRILEEIDRHFTAALEARAFLKATPAAHFTAILDKGSVPAAYRPTLFDILAQDALEFYMAGEQAGSKAEDAFDLEADGPALAPAEVFLAWRPMPRDTQSPTLKALRLFQELLAFHAKDPDPSAFADADLARLRFVHARGTGDGKETRYKEALARFAHRWSSHEVSARALAALAGQLRGEGAFVEARAQAERGLKAFPTSAGGAECFNLIGEIEQKKASLSTDRVWNGGLAMLEVTYRNLTRVHFRAIPVDFEAWMRSRRWLARFDNSQDEALLAGKPALAWQADLPPTPDYRDRTERVPAPKGLAPGFYVIVASPDPTFSAQASPVTVAPVWVSDLALVIRQGRPDGGCEGLVVDAVSGEPIAGARVTAWRAQDRGELRPVRTATTDGDGIFRISRTDRVYEALYLVASHQGQTVVSENYAQITGPREPARAQEQTVFFTDRALYRPGQTVSFKGIALRTDPEAADYKALPGRTVTVFFNDGNGKEIERRSFVTNAFGSFSGAFTAPRDRVLGHMSLHAADPQGMASIQVEEYKRPKFQVDLAAPAEAARLGGEVVVPGRAAAYTGAAIGGAKVVWRVERQVQMPRWCWWVEPSSAQAIAHGATVTEADGSFRIRFQAKPDPAVSLKDEPVFHYAIHADVTDTTGETRSDQRIVKVAPTALAATLAAADWLTADRPVELDVRTATHDGEGRPAEGTLAIHALQAPARVPRPGHGGFPRAWGSSSVKTDWDLARIDTWELGEAVATLPFRTGADGALKLPVNLKPGAYRALLESRDAFGRPVTARLTFQVLDPRATRYPVRVPDHLASPAWKVEPGGTFHALWGTGYDQGRALVELERDGKVLRRFWTSPGTTQTLVEHPVTEALRGGFILRTTFVRENRAQIHEQVVEVPWTDHRLTLKWEHLTSRLAPGRRETWTAVVSGPGATHAAAEMAATLYDASLDAFLPHAWPQGFAGFRMEGSRLRSSFEGGASFFQHVRGGWPRQSRAVDWRYGGLDGSLTQDLWGYRFLSATASLAPGVTRSAPMGGVSAPPPPPPMAKRGADGTAVVEVVASVASVDKTEVTTSSAVNLSMATLENMPGAPDLGKVAARKNLSETAFFMPHLQTGPDGTVRMEFTMPEALTEWRFLGFAHDAALRSGVLTAKAVTSKDLMVEPNPPRFLREGDTVAFTVKVSNTSGQPQSGRVRLELADARTGATMGQALGLAADADQAFEIPARGSRTFAWTLSVPDGCGFLTYRAVGATATLSDGEEGFLPVLSRRILVTESLPLPMRGPGERDFTFTRLVESAGSTTLRHESLTLQMVSQPAWYAVMALPYLMEFPYECSEQTFNRFYANALARHIAGSDPKIRRIFDQWKGTPALDSPLDKNQDLKGVMLEETPWLRQAQAEGAARRRVGLLFEENRMNEELARTLRKLADMQLEDGRWPWFPGGRASDYITLYVVTGFGRLRNLGVQVDADPAIKALESLDAWMTDAYRHIQHRDRYVPSPTDALYLYGRSFFLKDRPIAASHREAVDFFLARSRAAWLQLANRQSQAHLALALHRFRADKAKDPTPEAILRSLKERSVTSEELGRFWREQELSWWWYRAPIETQAMMIEAFGEIADDRQAVEDCQAWLLKQKQTQDWKTTKATADAIYALLLRGANKLASDALVEVSLGGVPVQPRQVEAGTGFFEERFVRGEVRPDMGRVALRKRDPGVAWGSLHWQYLEDVSKVKPHEGTPLRLRKALFVRETTASGPVLRPVTGPVKVGDELVVRIELRTDRDMEYVHLKDQRGSGTEPVNVLSGYRFQDGLATYESTRDTASHFFIDYLPKGTYVFEYPVRVQLRGRYQTGIASIQCMYAPEFNSHSESVELKVD